jgi:hypothetical protein
MLIHIKNLNLKVKSELQSRSRIILVEPALQRQASLAPSTRGATLMFNIL